MSLLEQHPWQAYVLFFGLFGVLLALLVVHIRDLRRLRETEFRFQQSLENSVDALYRLNLKTRTYDYISAAFKDQSGYECEEAIAGGYDFIIGLIHPDDILRFEKHKQDLLASPERGRKPESIEFRLRHKSGEYRWLRDSHVIVKDDSGQARWVIGSASDVTERHRAGEALRTSETRFKELVDMLPQGVFELDATGSATFANQYVLQLFGRSEADVERGLSVWDVIVPGDLERLEENLKLTLEGEERGVIEYTGLRKDGTTFPMVTHSAPILEDGAVIGIRGIVFDISEQRRAEDSLRKSEEKHRAVLEQSVDFIYLADLETKRILEANACLAVALGYTAEELAELTVYDFIDHPSEDIDARVQRVVNGEQFYFTDRKYVRRDGSSFEIEATVNCIEYGGKRALLVVSRDVTARRAVEAEIKASEEKYRLLVQSIRAAISVFDYDGEMHFINAYGASALGAEADQLIGKTKWDIFPEEIANQQMRVVRSVIDSGEAMVTETKIPIQNGQWRWYYSSVYPYTDAEDGKPRALVIAYDVSDYKKSEYALKESEETARALMDGTDDVMILLDRDRRILTLNQAAAKSLGRPAEDLIGLSSAEISETFMPSEVLDSWKAHTDEVIRTGKAVRREYEFEGNWVDGNIFPIRNETGEIVRIAVFASDITERRRAEEEYRKFKTITDHATFGSAIVSLQGEVSYLNPCFAKMHGYEPEELIGKNLSIFHNEEQLVEVDRINQMLRETGSYSSLEVWHTRRDGTIFPTLMNGVIIKDSDGSPAYLAATAIDISVHKDVEQALRDSEDRYRTLVESAGEAIFTLNRNGVYLFVNSIAAERIGLAVDDLVGKTLWDVFPKQYADGHMAGVMEVFTSGKRSMGERSTEIDGRRVQYRTSLQPIRNQRGEIISVLGIARDITSFIQAQKDLKGERDLVKSLLGTARSLVVCFDSQLRIAVFNKECERVTGYTAEEALGKRWVDLFADQADAPDEFGEWVLSQQEANREDTVLAKSGQMKTVLWSASVLSAERSDELTAIVVGQDITERKRTEKALQASEEFSRVVIENSPLGVSVRSSTGRLLSYNAAWMKIWNILGDDLDDYMNRHREELTFDKRDDYLGKAMNGVREVYEQGGYLHIPEIETPGTRKGRKRWLSQHFYAIMDARGEVSRVVILTEDITTRKLAEAKAREADSEKYRQAKEIAGGFAHEIRNALFPAEGALMRIMQTRQNFPPCEICDKYSGTASEAVERAIDITELITLYTRLDSEYFPESVDVCRVFHEVVEANEVRCEDQRVDVGLNCSEGLVVTSNRQQLYMVLNNLLLNSLDALTECADPVILATAIGESGIVKITFQDNGHGIPEKSLGRVFDAFFSLKPNKGTGLGLATTRKIIEMYGGTITVSSEPDRYTRFDLTLQRVTE